MVNQLYRPERDVIDAVEGADWMTVEKEWDYIEDAITATEKALDEALWDGDHDLANRYKRELEGHRIAVAVGEKYVTSW
jgi:hypothetical protein